MRHDIEMTFSGRADESFGPPLPAGRIECQIVVHERAVVVTGFRVEGVGGIAGQAVALKSLVHQVGRLATDLGFALDAEYVTSAVESQGQDMPEAYTAAVEMW